MNPDSFIEKARWQFAHTMAQWPHWYTLRKWNNDAEFVAFVKLIQSDGVLQKKLYWTRIYLDRGEYYYWVMSEAIDKITLINRALQTTAQRSIGDQRNAKGYT